MTDRELGFHLEKMVRDAYLKLERTTKVKKRLRKKLVWRETNPYWYRDHYALKKSNNRWRRCQRLDYELMMRRLKKEGGYGQG